MRKVWRCRYAFHMTSSPPPKIPESVLVVIHTPDLQVLLIERADKPGFWQSVTGSKDTLEESLHETARREVADRAIGPARRKGTVQIGSLDSLVQYLKAYKGPHTVAFAAPSKPGIEALLDYHPAGAQGEARWCQDRVVYACPFSRQWQTWVGAEGKARGQIEFGDFLEANEADLSSREGFANAATMITVARNLVVNSVGKFQRTVNPTTGEGSLIVKDEHDASTSTTIPKGFALAIPVFEGTTDLYPVEARMRFTMDGGRPTFTFVLANKEAVLEHALATLRQQVAEGAGIPVFVGQAPAAVAR